MRPCAGAPVRPWRRFARFRTQEAVVPGFPDGHVCTVATNVTTNVTTESCTDVPNYWWKRLTPPIEFGAMHMILFQLALIPLTVSRSFLAYLSKWGNLPLEHVMQVHIQIGYMFCITMVLSSVLFFAFFGKVCTDHLNNQDPLDTCAKFSSEIMGTGYAILGVTLIVLGTSFFRARLKYEIFWGCHLLVLAMYILATIHTLDKEFREGTKIGKARSQTFKWYSASLMIYVSDRVWRYMMTARQLEVVDAIVSSDGRALVVHVVRPWSYRFSPGQYAYLTCHAIDPIGHPFSIGSDPDEQYMTFLIEVKGSVLDALAAVVLACVQAR